MMICSVDITRVCDCFMEKTHSVPPRYYTSLIPLLSEFATEIAQRPLDLASYSATTQFIAWYVLHFLF